MYKSQEEAKQKENPEVTPRKATNNIFDTGFKMPKKMKEHTKKVAVNDIRPPPVDQDVKMEHEKASPDY